MVSAALVEIGNAAYNIYLAKQKWNEGLLIKSRIEFIKEVVDIVLLALSRCGGTIAGMFVGQCLIPIPFVGSLIGLLLGTWAGHIGGKVIARNSSSFIASVVDKLME